MKDNTSVAEKPVFYDATDNVSISNLHGRASMFLLQE